MPVIQLILLISIVSCAHYGKNQKFEDRLNAQSAASLNQVEENLKDLLISHEELNPTQKTAIAEKLKNFINSQKALRAREQKLLELGLGDAIYASEVSKSQWQQEVRQLYEEKAENVRRTVREVHDLTQDPPVKKNFFHEFPLLMREVP